MLLPDAQDTLAQGRCLRIFALLKVNFPQVVERVCGIILLVISLLTLLLLLLRFFLDTQHSYISTTHDFATSHASSIRVGYWLYVMCIAVAVGGSLLVVVSSRQAKLTQKTSQGIPT